MFYRHSQWTVAPTHFIRLSVCLGVCVSVCLSRFYGLYLAYYGLDFDQNGGQMAEWLKSKCSGRDNASKVIV